MLHHATFDTTLPVSMPRPSDGAHPLPVRSVLGQPVVNATTEETIAALMDATGPRHVYFLNAHCANLRAGNARYRSALARADFVLPDGIGVELCVKMQGDTLRENLNGTDFTPRLLQAAAQRGQSVFLLGGRPGTAEAAAATLARKIPGLRIAGTLNGYDEARDEDRAVDCINRSGADILLVALGVPMQELWLERNATRLAPRLRLGVGALFDFLAGTVTRAPEPVRKARCEWVWRLAMEPRRMARRYLIGNVSFLARALRHTLAGGRRANLGKRALDLGLSLGALTVLAPLFALVALAIRIDSPGPVFFTQERVGRNGKPFRMIKFRSMYTDAEERREALLASSDRAGVCFKSRHDPRVTRIGRLLRRSSLDELPQIMNVLFGQMSLVGPRPALPQEVASYPAAALERLQVKPGLTGVWQVSGRADISFERMVQMDVAYARSRSVLLDILLILLTVRVVVSGRGAY